GLWSGGFAAGLGGRCLPHRGQLFHVHDVSDDLRAWREGAGDPYEDGRRCDSAANGASRGPVKRRDIVCGACGLLCRCGTVCVARVRRGSRGDCCRACAGGGMKWPARQPLSSWFYSAPSSRTMDTDADAPMRLAPASSIVFTSARVRIPPEAFTP